MSIFRKLNPFRSYCCEVPLLIGDPATTGSVVSGIGEFEGREFEFVGVMLGDGVDQDKVGDDLDALCSVLVNTGKRGAWRSA